MGEFMRLRSVEVRHLALPLRRCKGSGPDNLLLSLPVSLRQIHVDSLPRNRRGSFLPVAETSGSPGSPPQQELNARESSQAPGTLVACVCLGRCGPSPSANVFGAKVPDWMGPLECRPSEQRLGRHHRCRTRTYTHLERAAAERLSPDAAQVPGCLVPRGIQRPLRAGPKARAPTRAKSLRRGPLSGYRPK